MGIRPVDAMRWFHRLRYQTSAALFLVTVLCVLPSCSVSTHHGGLNPPTLTTDSNMPQPPAPSELAKQTHSVQPGQLKKGSEFAQNLPQSHASPEEDSLVLRPSISWLNGVSGKLAHATYLFSLDDKNLAPVVFAKYSIEMQPPEKWSQLWIGLSNWQQDTWDWYVMDNGESQLSELDSYINDENLLLLTVAYMHGSRCTVDWLRIGDALPPPVSMVAAPLWGQPPLHVELTAQAGDYFQEIISYEWDYDGDGVIDETTDSGSSNDHTYYELGKYTASLRVTNLEGLSNTAQAVIECTPPWRYTQLTAGTDPVVLAVDDRPAILYFSNFFEADPPYRELRYAIAQNSSGTAWNDPVTVLTMDYYGNIIPEDFAVINGMPAFCYSYLYNDPPGYFYITAIDIEGSAWTEGSLMLPLEDWAGGFSLAEFDGRPAVSFIYGPHHTLHYMRAEEDFGTLWPEPLELDSAEPLARKTDMLLAGSVPAIAYLSDKSISYISATDSKGNQWYEPTRVIEDSGFLTFTPPLSGVWTEDGPAIVFGSELPTPGEVQLLFKRALHIQGLSWDTPVPIYGSCCDSDDPSVALHGGNIYVAFQGYLPDVLYLRACIVKGSAADGAIWTGPDPVNLYDPATGWNSHVMPVPMCVVGDRLCTTLAKGGGEPDQPMIFVSRELLEQ